MGAVRKKKMRASAFVPVTQENTLNFLLLECEGNILYDGGEDDLKPTPKAVRDKGIIICSECGQYNSDSLSTCKYCHEKLIYVKPINEI